MKQETEKVLLSGFIGAFFMFIFMFIIPELYKAISNSDLELEYNTLQPKKVSKGELIRVNRDNFGSEKIDFSMDDNIISDYYYVALEIKNIGSLIEDDVIIDLYFDDPDFKILDVMCKMQKPEERKINAEIERPPLELNPSITGADSDKIEINFEIDKLQVGAIIYRSYVKDVGFGRINILPVTENNFSIKIKSKLKSYFTITHMGSSGEESGFTNKIPFPDVKFNSFSFKNTVNLDVENDDLVKTLGKYRAEFDDKKIFLLI